MGLALCFRVYCEGLRGLIIQWLSPKPYSRHLGPLSPRADRLFFVVVLVLVFVPGFSEAQ